MNKQSAEFVLHMLMGTLLVMVVFACGLGAWGLRESHQGAAVATALARDLGQAAGLARAADMGARSLAADHAQLLGRVDSATHVGHVTDGLRRQQETIQKSLAEARALLARQGMETTTLTQAEQLLGRLMQQYATSVQQAGSGLPAAAVTDRWVDVAPGIEVAGRQARARLDEANAQHAETQLWAMAALVVATFGLCWFFRWWIRRANVGPLRTATKLVQRVAHGDLTVAVDGMDALHTRKLAEGLNLMTASLRTMATEVKLGARMVADTSAQIAQGHVDLSQRTEEQASTLEQTASSMEELTSTVAHNADNARQASQLAVSASEVARKGGQVVGQVVETMTDISDASRKIGDIISVIDGIAFQTNILALNAAVEAARAGDQGRGFAVVAAEVRTLAQRSAAAAKEIKTLIGDSVDRVEAGTRLVNNAGRTMQDIVESVRKVSDLIAEIAAASQEQSAGIGQVNTAISQMEQVVQQNASLVEEATAATEALKEQAAGLLQLVSHFKVEAGQVAARRPPLSRLKPASRSTAVVTRRDRAGASLPLPEAPAAPPASRAPSASTARPCRPKPAPGGGGAF